MYHNGFLWRLNFLKHINMHILVILLSYHTHIYDNAIQGMYS